MVILLVHPQLGHYFVLSTLALMATIIGFLLERHILVKYKRNISPAIAIIPLALTPVICFLEQDILNIIKELILLVILIYASVSDIKTREVDNYVHIIIAIIALINISVQNIPQMLLGVLSALPLLVIAIFKKESIGGADIKLTAVLGFLLGFEKGVASLIISLTFSIICTLLYRKIRKHKTSNSFALIPYLSVGGFIMYLI